VVYMVIRIIWALQKFQHFNTYMALVELQVNPGVVVVSFQLYTLYLILKLLPFYRDNKNNNDNKI